MNLKQVEQLNLFTEQLELGLNETICFHEWSKSSNKVFCIKCGEHAIISNVIYSNNNQEIFDSIARNRKLK